MTPLKYFITCLLLAVSANVLAAPPTFELPYNQWKMISLPASPPNSANTVAGILGDNMGTDGNYNQNWVVYAYNTEANTYGDPLVEADVLEKGKGYWIIQIIAEDQPVILNMPPGSAQTSNAESIPLASAPDESERQWNLAGNPFSSSLNLGEIRLVTDAETCSDSNCDLNRAEENNLLHNKIWTYEDNGYIEKDINGQLSSWGGFWAVALSGSKGHSLALSASASVSAPVTGRITSTTGAEISGVSVKVLKNGETQTETATSSANGQFDLALAADSEYTLTFSNEGFANRVQRVKTTQSGKNIDLDITLIPRVAPQDIENIASVTLTGDDGASVSLDTTFKDSQGNEVTAADGVKLSITPIDVSSPVGVAAFPGDFAGAPEGQTETTPIISYGTVEYQITRASDGEVLQLADGKTADIQIPIYTSKHQDGSGIAEGDTILFHSLNETTGLWTQEGTGTVVTSTASPTGFALSATVSHFTWWNCDVTMNSAKAKVTVTAAEAGSALIKARTVANIGWRPNTVDTVVNVGGTSNPLPIPSNGEVCFWAEISFNSGSRATTPESCVTAASNATVNVNLEIPGGTLSIGTNPAGSITSYINGYVGQVKIQPATAESQVTYSIKSGSLPTGVTLNTIDSTTAVMSGTPTQAGEFNLVIEGVDADSNTADTSFTYIVIDGVEPPDLQSTGDSIHDRPLGDPTTSQHDFRDVNRGGPVTNWSVDHDSISAAMYRIVQVFDPMNPNPGPGEQHLYDPIPGEQFDVSINADTGIVTINWPFIDIENNPYGPVMHAEVELKFTLTASNSAGSSSSNASVVFYR